MTTKRQMRVSKNRIPSHITAEYLGGLCADAFLAEGGNRNYPDKLTPEEHQMVWEFEKCKCDFEKWLKFRERKLKIQKVGRLKN